MLNLFDEKLLVGNWFGMSYGDGFSMIQYRFSDNGTFQFADYGRGKQVSGTYNVAGSEIVFRNAANGTEQRRQIISCERNRIILEFSEIGQTVEFKPDRPAP